MRRGAAGAVLGLLLGGAALFWWRTHNIGLVQRGSRLAAERGCLSCHGAGGAQADPDGSRGIGSVPSFGHDDVSMHARSEQEIREWIRDGRPSRLAQEDSGEEEAAVLQMPAWGGVLSAGEQDALVAYVKAVSDFDPLPDDIARGRETAASLGCFACHGPQGRGDTPNPGSLKGYIPSWSGADFPELARDDGEIREWIRDGAPRRLREHPVAAFFVRRQHLRMPAYADRVSEAEIRSITDYIRWLRQPAAGAPRAR